MGKYGSMAFYKGEIFQQDAIDFERIIDTTGCGDTYQAAFAYYYLTSNKDIREAMKQGTYWASLATQRWSSGIRIG
jgi:fructoselysine 6-kinase